MFGRPTGNARHLEHPESKILFASMEEGIYEVDLETLAVTELWGDEDNTNSPRKADLPGYHGKGFYSGQGVYIYSNNGEHGKEARVNPNVPSGVLAEWDGKADAWTVVRRNQFTEVTGPGGIYGSKNPATDPIWTIGWDHRSLILGVRMADSGWHFYRMPKASHSYDGAHGWNTEWPRIREIGEDDMLMTMHGTFWRFPKDFSPESSAGIEPRSNHLKVTGDFARWGDRIVIGCADTARDEFLNKRAAKGDIEAPQSQSNLWFIQPEQLDQLGPAIGRGSVWLNDPVVAGEPSDPYLFAGYARRGLHLAHEAERPATINLERDLEGNGEWTPWKSIEVPAMGYHFEAFSPEDAGVWIRLVSEVDLKNATASFSYREAQPAHPISSEFRALARTGDSMSGGLIRALGDNSRNLLFTAVDAAGDPVGTYEMDGDLNLVPVEADFEAEVEKMALI
jgi:hypothetical protein